MKLEDLSKKWLIAIIFATVVLGPYLLSRGDIISANLLHNGTSQNMVLILDMLFYILRIILIVLLTVMSIFLLEKFPISTNLGLGFRNADRIKRFITIFVVSVLVSSTISLLKSLYLYF